MTRESWYAVPSSAITTGILPSGFCLRTLSLTSVVSAVSIVTSLSRPSSEIAIRTLRQNGEAGEERRIIIATPLTLLILFAGALFCGGHFCGEHFCGNALRAQCNSSAFGRAAARYFATRRAPTRRGNVTLSGDDELDRFRTLALLVGLHIEADALTLDPRYHA